MRMVLTNIIAENQGACIRGRFIAHHVLISQDVVRSYGRKTTSPSCLIKMDMKKVYGLGMGVLYKRC